MVLGTDDFMYVLRTRLFTQVEMLILPMLGGLCGSALITIQLNSIQNRPGGLITSNEQIMNAMKAQGKALITAKRGVALLLSDYAIRFLW